MSPRLLTSVQFVVDEDMSMSSESAVRPGARLPATTMNFKAANGDLHELERIT